jgi:hypothetical protein
MLNAFQQYGTARVYFKDSSVLWYDLRNGDVAYVPAGTPTALCPSRNHW